ncbi:MAG: response regulator, partial [Treponema sp.]|nr:response regulator [Treponema sp.]
MTEKHFDLNDETLAFVEYLGLNMPGGFFIYKAAGNEELIYANHVVLDIFACKDMEEFKALTGWTFKGMVHEDDYARISSSISQQIAESEGKLDYAEYRIRRKDGAIRWVDDYGHYAETEAFGGIYYVFISDITERRERVKEEARRQELEARLALQEKLLQEQQKRVQQDSMITSLASDYRSVYHVDLDNDDAVCYRGDSDDRHRHREGEHFSFHESFSYYAEKCVVGEYREGFLKFIDPETIQKNLSSGPIATYRYLARLGDKEYYEMIRLADVQKAGERTDGRVHAMSLGLAVIDKEMRDSMAKNHALAEALSAAESASKAKTAFLSNMSHEIRTPMNAIIGLNSLALRDESLSPKTKDYLDKIGGSARHLLALINDILDMTRIESGKLVLRTKEFSLESVLEQINTMLLAQCNDKGIKFECFTGLGVTGSYIGDDMKLKQVLINILGNAVKFTPASGEIRLTVERTAVFQGQTTLKFTIKDTGIGMDKSFLPKIFDAFSQEGNGGGSKYGSTGLGMAITKNIVEMMNGTISVDSEKGKGTTFTVIISLKNCAPKIASQDINSGMNTKKLKVLVVDDDSIACEHAQLVLAESGICVDTCLSGTEALQMLEVQHTKQTPYNLVLLDWKMPDMDGLEVTKLIRSHYDNETTVIILTAYNWDDIMNDAMQAGVDSFLSKPLMASSIMDEFERIARKNNLCMYKEKKLADIAGRKLLLAEDILVNAEIIKELLDIRKVSVDYAENGKQALEMFQKSEPGHYDAILMDVRMPQMDGLEATKLLRAMDRQDAKTVPIIALTANAFDEDVQLSLQVGMDAHLSKPVEPDQLYQTLG